MRTQLELAYSTEDSWLEGYQYRVTVLRFIKDPEKGLPPRYWLFKDFGSAEAWVEEQKFEITMYCKYRSIISLEERTGNTSELVKELSTYITA